MAQFAEGVRIKACGQWSEWVWMGLYSEEGISSSPLPHLTSPIPISCSYPRKYKHRKSQRGKSKRNPPEESPGISNTKEDPSWRQKEVIMMCQRDNFVPTKFEIQIWVWNFWRRVDYYKIWRYGFPFARLTFLLRGRSGNQTDVAEILKPSVPPLYQLIDYPRSQLFASFLLFLLSLGSISQNTGLPGRMGKILVKKFSWVAFFSQHGFWY